MGAPPAPRKDPVPTPTPADLHARADAIWRPVCPGDAGANIYSATAAAMLAGTVVRSPRAAKWVHSLDRYEDHWRERGHAPRENTRARHTLPQKNVASANGVAINAALKTSSTLTSGHA